MKIKCAEIRVLRRIGTMIGFYRIINKYIRGNLGIMHKIGKIRENRLECFGHVERRR